ncbi:putative ATPase/DNA-binding SARP family transcriptional activator [Streptosporangium becharense]|uniref:Putative ATPase/DNA-binding SARP family transcriptional activator n=1 Tax=Streptosporangium becharense TaxID=1816182 RepID=A0A7W9IKB9_9ACTN|nr:BTAD domain-containing putative transcriptional regulator [Streptosporangium becharense]MBB2911849.1 putative ATPase/DNA-binding SARP family transcriptional activator [Streptosporangium becharense]MBB5822333.1 putative ATPase/DNA-binding SARP family transcriptional activator [Streptosporangium becharense]
MEGVKADGEISFAILGPLLVRRPGKTVEVTGRRLRALLALLLLDAGRTVPIDRIVAGVWEEHLPNAVGNALQALVSRLRAILDDRELVRGGPAGYRLAVDPDLVDAHRFARLAARGHAALAAGSPGDAATALRAALALWRGPALADLAGNDIVAAAVARFDALRLAALEDRFETDLLLGRHTEAAAELPALIAAHPLRERLRDQLMRALYGMGRRVEALAAFEEARAAFAAELGADPSPRLSRLHLAMLRGEWAEAAGGTGSVAGGAGPVVGGAESAVSDVGPVVGGAGPVVDAPPGVSPPRPAALSAHLRSGRGSEHAASRVYDRDDPSPEAGKTRRSNLRARFTSFVGRERDVARTAGLLGEHRLVTLLGPGGAGKSRLADEVAETVADRMSDGVWLVELAPVAEPSEVPQAVFSALELRDGLPVATGPPGTVAVPTPRAPQARLLSALADKRLLIVLDNCEHVVEAAAALADRILAACPGVRVLATSREPLGITGEVAWPVPPLDLPPVGGDPERVLGYPAVRLFTERAAAVRPGYRPGGEAAAVARICRELDGMPLAIELAAARLRSLSAGQIADRLDDRFRLLTGGSRTAMPRHQTLRAVVEWSWDLLDGQERVLVRRLAVFAGGATLDSVERVCSGAGLARDDVLDVLSRLVDKSLLTAYDHGGTIRYRMLETIRAYAAERLAEAGEQDTVRLAHATFFTGLAEARDPETRGRRQVEALAELTAEHDNLLAALRWSTEEARYDLALGLVGALSWFWWLRGYRVEGARRARELLGPARGEAPQALTLARACFGALAIGAGIELDTARKEMAEVVRRTETSDPPPHPLIMMAAPVVGMFGDLPAGEGRGSHLTRMFAHPDPWVVTSAHLFQGFECFLMGRVREGGQEMKTALRGFRALGDRWGTANALAALADMDFLHGEPARALERIHAAVALLEELGALDEISQLRGRLALGLKLEGDHAAAEEILSETLRNARRNGDRIAALNLLSARGDFAREDGAPAAARRHYAEALRIIEETPSIPPQVGAVVNASLGLLAEQEGDLSGSRKLLGVALEQAERTTEAPVLGLVLIGFAGQAVAEGDPGTAAVLLGAAARIRGIDAVVDFDHVRITERTRAALGAEEYGHQYGQGRLLNREEAVELARGLSEGGGDAACGGVS